MSAQPNSVDIHFLRAGEIEVGLAPVLGGAISHAKVAGVDFMRPWTGELTPRRTCGYPLVPFSNRIANGHFRFEERDYELARNFGDHPHTLHGVGWQRTWDFERISEAEARMTLHHRPQDNDADKQSWPFAFDVEQCFKVDNTGLTVQMHFHNRDERAMPVGLGWHPFFPRHDGVELQFDAQAVFINDEGMLPKERIVPAKEWCFNPAQKLAYPGLDNCFAGWNGQARLVWPGKKLALQMSASEGLHHLVVMTPPAPADFFAVEPVSHANNAINQHNPAEHGIRTLAPGECWEVSMRLSVERMD